MLGYRTVVFSLAKIGIFLLGHCFKAVFNAFKSYNSPYLIVQNHYQNIQTPTLHPFNSGWILWIIVNFSLTLRCKPLNCMLRTLISFTPFTVCLWWLITFVLNYRKADCAQRTLIWYILTCTVLYLCHALYFTSQLPLGLECVWTLCSLSVYPLYYLYISRLTSRELPRWIGLTLVPAVLISAFKLMFPGGVADIIRQAVFIVQIPLVCYFGYRMLSAFDRKLTDMYADMDGRSTSVIKKLLVAILVISCVAATANTLGRRYFGQGDWLLAGIAIAFSALQYALCYIGYTHNFTIEHLEKDLSDIQPEAQCDDHEAHTPGALEEVGKKIHSLMTEEKMFLKQNLKIGDVVRASGSCRTYISAYINQTGYNFSEYINKLRVEHAQKLLILSPDIKMVVIAEESGFTSETSFYRNFKKFTGMTPQEWLKKKSE